MPETPTIPNTPFSGLDLLSSSVILVDADLAIRYMNSAAEDLLAISGKTVCGSRLDRVAGCPATLLEALENALAHGWSHSGQSIEIKRHDDVVLHLNCTVNPVDTAEARLLVELWPIDQQIKATREERLLEQQLANRELIRNLAHEIKNPLGGIRGAAQLLGDELADPELKQYTQVIMDEADRLQALMRRMLSSHHAMQPAPINIHEILEPIRKLICAEFPDLTVRCDYDISLPEIAGDREQLIQVVLNIMRNAAQAVSGNGEITLRTRIRRQVTLAKKRHRLALELQIIDNGPGIPDAIRDRVFYPLVSARSGGTGLGLALAHDFIWQHQGSIEVESVPGRTCFTVCLPLLNATPEEKQ